VLKVNGLGVMLSRGNNELILHYQFSIINSPFSIHSTDCHAALAKTLFFGGIAETAAGKQLSNQQPTTNNQQPTTNNQ